MLMSVGKKDACLESCSFELVLCRNCVSEGCVYKLYASLDVVCNKLSEDICLFGNELMYNKFGLCYISRVVDFGTV